MKGTKTFPWRARVKSLELELQVLKAQMSREPSPETPPFASLYGALQGRSNSTEEEIRGVEYRLSDEP